MGKGSGRRPQQVSDEQMLSAWEQIFGRKEEVKEQEETEQNNDTTNTTANSRDVQYPATQRQAVAAFARIPAACFGLVAQDSPLDYG